MAYHMGERKSFRKKCSYYRGKSYVCFITDKMILINIYGLKIFMIIVVVSFVSTPNTWT